MFNSLHKTARSNRLQTFTSTPYQIPRTKPNPVPLQAAWINMSDLPRPLDSQSVTNFEKLKSYPVKRDSKVSMVTVPGFPIALCVSFLCFLMLTTLCLQLASAGWNARANPTSMLLQEINSSSRSSCAYEPLAPCWEEITLQIQGTSVP